MKIAFCFAGHLRTFRQNKTLGPSLLDHYPEADVFIHTFPVIDLARPAWHSDRFRAGARVTKEDLLFVRQQFRPKSLTLDKRDCGGDWLGKPYEKMGYRWGWAKAHEARIAQERLTGPYDVVMNVRFDLVLPERFEIPAVAPDTVYAGYCPWQQNLNVDGEVWTLGSSQTMTRLFTPALPEEEKKFVPAYGWTGERMFKSIRTRAGIAYVPMAKVRYGLLRKFGVKWTWNPDWE